MQRAKDYNFVVLLSTGDGAVAGSAVAVSVLSEPVQLPDQPLLSQVDFMLNNGSRVAEPAPHMGGIDFVYCHFQVRACAAALLRADMAIAAGSNTFVVLPLPYNCFHSPRSCEN